MSVEYYPVEKYFYSSTQNDCGRHGNDLYFVKDHIAGGVRGDVYRVCCAEDCNYVLKYSKIRPQLKEYDIDTFQNEVVMQNEVAKLGLAKPVVDAWLTSNALIIVTPILEETLGEYILRDTPDKNQKILEAFDLLDRLHQAGYQHNDAHVNNIMLDDRGTLYLIDLANVTELVSPSLDFQNLFNDLDSRMLLDHELTTDILIAYPTDST